jgi:phospholipase/carboxylesterase
MLETIEIDTAPDPKFAVIWLHGLGADGNDFVPMVDQFKIAGFPTIRFIFPNAPTMPVTVNNGYVMRAWYDILGIDLTRREDEAGVHKSQKLLEELITAQIERGIRASRIMLAGFSQGCAMTLQTGLRYPEKLAGLLCLSGYLPLASSLSSERSAANRDVPIFMAHGLGDMVVPFQRATESRNLLQELGYKIDWHEYLMPHSVHPQEIIDIGVWMQQILK